MSPDIIVSRAKERLGISDLTPMQQKMLHIDFVVDDLQRAQQHALACGARPSAEIFFPAVRTFFDPAGHPFCFFTDSQYQWE